MGGFIDAFEPENHPDKCVGYLPQLFAYRFQSLDNDYPTLDEYLCSLKEIFAACLRGDRDTVFMTPNMLNTYVAGDTPREYLSYAAVTAEYQTGGRMDRYMKETRALAEDMGVTVCDCYSEWKKRAETEDTTLLLANRINHPVREMHELFAVKLLDVLLEKV